MMPMIYRPVSPRNANCVAIVDDDVATIRHVERTLTRSALLVQPITTPDPQDAARVLLRNGCSVALVSFHMYGTPVGLEMARLIRREIPATSLALVMTIASSREAARHADELRALDCSLLLKPFDDRALLYAIRCARATVDFIPVDKSLDADLERRGRASVA